MRRFRLPRTTAALFAGALAAGLLAGTAATASAASYPTCNGVKKVDLGNNYWIHQPYYTGTGSRNCVMSRGAQSDAVSQLQVAMWWCYSGLMEENDIDGIYGPMTRNAVYELQGLEKVGQDGVYGPETRKAMEWPGGLGNESGGCFTTTK
jgi:peptidoglycan hydrolase-like protein with peptidoglycan-binding domain